MSSAVHLDFETFSTAPLKVCGAYHYAQHATTEVLCCCWAVDDEPVCTWVPRLDDDEARKFRFPRNKFWFYGPTVPEPLAEAIRSGMHVIAHNAQFERAVWQAIVVKRHGGPPIKRGQFVCTAARAAAANLPRSLGGVGMALDTKHQKDKEGARLLKMFAMPRKPSKKDDRVRILPLDAPDEFRKLCDYCADDVRTERDVDKLIPALHPTEQALYTFDMEINERGLLLDIPLVRKASTVLKRLEQNIILDVQRRTTCEAWPEGLRPTQRDKMMQFFSSIGVELENLQADHVRKYLKTNAATLPAVARELLLLRIEAGKSSTKKFVSMMACTTWRDHRARGTLLFYGASTGRWCIEENTLVVVLDANGAVRRRKIQHVRSTDWLWDGTEWVRHEGVVESGIRETMEYDGVKATPEHEVWVSPNKKLKLGIAEAAGVRIWKSQPWAVYCMTFPNGKRYFGITNRPSRRKSDHAKGRYSGQILQNAFTAYGSADFKILKWVGGREQAELLERALIAKFKTDNLEHGYNMTAGGDCGPGFTPAQQRAASKLGVARLRELRSDPAFAKKLNAAVSRGVRKSPAHAEANRAKAAAKKGKSATNPEACRANFRKGKEANLRRVADLRSLGLLKTQTKPVSREEKNRRVAEGMKAYAARLTPEQKRKATAAARANIVWDDARRDQQRQVMSKAIREYWRKKREADI